MKLILDEDLPLRAAAALRELGVEAVHVLELEMRGASDRAILDKARSLGAAVATRDADFHQILATTGADAPSVIRVRIEWLDASQLAGILSDVLQTAANELRLGAAISVNRKRLRFRRLPIR
jgi:predicted nuclease of predicted toxin-antitoxin system